MSSYREMKNICNNEHKEFLKLVNVNGIGIGYKKIKGTNIGEICLQVFVSKKIDIRNLKEREIIPKEYRGIKTDVVEIGEVRARLLNTRIRPVTGGYSVSRTGTNEVGTYGCMVSTGTGNSLVNYVLSNNHVIADNNNAPIGATILQPGQGDGGVNPGDAIATLSDFVPIDFMGGNNIVDAAIAEITNLADVSDDITFLGQVNGIASAVLDLPVTKVGRSTEQTIGVIESINATLNVTFGGQNAIFVNQFLTNDISEPGDSGSILLDNQNRAIGLLFAGSETITAYNDIREVLSSFRARLV